MTPHFFPLNPKRSQKITPDAQNFFSLKDINDIFSSAESQILFRKYGGANDKLASALIRHTVYRDNANKLAQFIEQGLNPHATLMEDSNSQIGRNTLGELCVYNNAVRCLALLAPMIDLTENFYSACRLEKIECAKIILHHTQTSIDWVEETPEILRKGLLGSHAQDWFDLYFNQGLTTQRLTTPDNYGFSVFYDMVIQSFDAQIYQSQPPDTDYDYYPVFEPLAIIHHIIRSYPHATDSDTLKKSLDHLTDGSPEYEAQYAQLCEFFQAVKDKHILEKNLSQKANPLKSSFKI